MADKELRKMNRTELIEIIYALQQNEHNLQEENARLQARLDDKLQLIRSSGSIAEAALSLNHIFEDAEQAAQQYLASIRETNGTAEQILAEARQKADTILAEAEAKTSAEKKPEPADSTEESESTPPEEKKLEDTDVS